VHKDVRHGALAGLLLQIRLDVGALAHLVQLDRADLRRTQVQARDDLLRALAVRTVRLAEDGNDVLADQFLGQRTQRTSAICLAAMVAEGRPELPRT